MKRFSDFVLLVAIVCALPLAGLALGISSAARIIRNPQPED